MFGEADAGDEAGGPTGVGIEQRDGHPAGVDVAGADEESGLVFVAFGGVTEGGDGDVEDFLGEVFGGGDDFGGDFQEEFTEAFGDAFDAFHVDHGQVGFAFGVGEDGVGGDVFFGHEGRPDVGFGDEDEEGAVVFLVGGEAGVFADAHGGFGEDGFLAEGLEGSGDLGVVGDGFGALAEARILGGVEEEHEDFGAGEVAGHGGEGGVLADAVVFAGVVVEAHNTAKAGAEGGAGVVGGGVEAEQEGFGKLGFLAADGDGAVEITLGAGFFKDDGAFGVFGEEEGFFVAVVDPVGLFIAIGKDDGELFGEALAEFPGHGGQEVGFARAGGADDGDEGDGIFEQDAGDDEVAFGAGEVVTDHAAGVDGLAF